MPTSIPGGSNTPRPKIGEGLRPGVILQCATRNVAPMLPWGKPRRVLD